MITLKQLFKNLAFSELANISIGDATTGAIDPNNYERLTTGVRLGLTALHQRFLIRAESVVIRNYPQIGRYYLATKYARSNTESLELIKYIEDTGIRPFTDNVLKIDQVFDEVGREFELNVTTASDPIFTPEYNCIAMTPVVGNALWTVVYRADHTPFTVDADTDLSTIELAIPPQYVEPLQAYTASRVLGGMGHSSLEGRSDGDALMLRYEALCSRMETQNLDIDDNDTHTRLEDNGWV